uniref:Uncharacterized protein n=1 Tax=Arundo donax TaxID=35708 RepID=A0A0A9H860_ARUDO
MCSFSLLSIVVLNFLFRRPHGTWGAALTKSVHDTSRASDLSLYDMKPYMNFTDFKKLVRNIFFSVDEWNNMPEGQLIICRSIHMNMLVFILLHVNSSQ